MSRYAVRLSGPDLNRTIYADLLHFQEADGKVTIELVPALPAPLMTEYRYGEAVAIDLNPVYRQMLNNAQERAVLPELINAWVQERQQQQRRPIQFQGFRRWMDGDD